MKPPAPNITGTPGPRRPDPLISEIQEIREILDIADALQARARARLSRLSSVGRLRKWGTV